MTLQILKHSVAFTLQVLWLPSERRDLVQKIDPALQQTSGNKASIEELQDNHIVRLNLHYSSMSQEHIRYYTSIRSVPTTPLHLQCNYITYKSDHIPLLWVYHTHLHVFFSALH